MQIYFYPARATLQPPPGFRFKERLVFSAIVYRNRFRDAPKRRWLRDFLGIHASSLRQCIRNLKKLKLVGEDRANRFMAYEPGGEAREWFSWRERVAEGADWMGRLTFLKLRLNENGLSDATNAVWGALASLASGKKRTSQRKLARRLGLSLMTVRRALKELKKVGILKYTAGNNGLDFELVGEPEKGVPKERVQNVKTEPPAPPEDFVERVLWKNGFSPYHPTNYPPGEPLPCGCESHPCRFWRWLESQAPVEARVAKWREALEARLGVEVEAFRAEYYCYRCKVSVEGPAVLRVHHVGDNGWTEVLVPLKLESKDIG